MARVAATPPPSRPRAQTVTAVTTGAKSVADNFTDETRGVEGVRSVRTGVCLKDRLRFRIGIPSRDLPPCQFGPWRTVWKRHPRYAGEGTWDRVLQVLAGTDDADDQLDWSCRSAPRSIERISTRQA